MVPQFRPGILKASLLIPTVSIVHRTEILWKNIVAYQSETVRADERGLHDQFIYFLKFMDELVNTDEDVSFVSSLQSPVFDFSVLLYLVDTLICLPWHSGSFHVHLTKVDVTDC